MKNKDNSSVLTMCRPVINNNNNIYLNLSVHIGHVVYWLTRRPVASKNRVRFSACPKAAISDVWYLFDHPHQQNLNNILHLNIFLRGKMLR